MWKFLLFFFISVTVISCKNSPKKNINVSNIDVKLEVNRLDVDFFTADSTELSTLKNKYPLFFPNSVPDSVWINKLKNKKEKELFEEVQKVFLDFSVQETQISTLFKHIKYYFPSFKIPQVVTLLSNIDYGNNVIYTEDFLIISLDFYLGRNHTYYNDFPDYIKRNYQKEHLTIDIASKIIEKQLPKEKQNFFLHKIINEGVKMFLLDTYLPVIPIAEKMGYDNDKLDWALKNEAQVWSFFIENQLLFNTESKLEQRFIDLAPFSKFYSNGDNLSPGRIGVWIGWQIVRSFMEHNNVSLQDLIKTNPEIIFKKSKYKPK